MKIIDTHFHIWDLSVLKLDWLEENPLLKHDFLIQDYIQEYQNLEFYGGIYIEVDCNQAYKDIEKQYILNLANPMIKGIILSQKLSSSMDISYNPLFKGIREVLHTKNSPIKRCLEKSFLEGLEILNKHHLVFESCNRQEDLQDLYQSAKQVKTTIILNHIGNPKLNNFKTSEGKKYLHYLSQLANLPNVICKLSGIDLKNNDLKDVVYLLEFCLNTFNDKNLIYGSNFPVSNHDKSTQEWVKLILRVCKTKKLVEKIFYGNPKRIYNIN